MTGGNVSLLDISDHFRIIFFVGRHVGWCHEQSRFCTGLGDFSIKRFNRRKKLYSAFLR